MAAPKPLDGLIGDRITEGSSSKESSGTPQEARSITGLQ